MDLVANKLNTYPVILILWFQFSFLILSIDELRQDPFMDNCLFSKVNMYWMYQDPSFLWYTTIIDL
jgi:hypothetical protein